MKKIFKGITVLILGAFVMIMGINLIGYGIDSEMEQQKNKMSSYWEEIEEKSFDK